MRPGYRAYNKHFYIIGILMILSIFLGSKGYIPKGIFVLLFLFTFLYAILFWFGFVLEVGPFKHISSGLKKDYKDELEETTNKQPWE